jgi:ABC-type maltose transport system permease subunit
MSWPRYCGRSKLCLGFVVVVIFVVIIVVIFIVVVVVIVVVAVVVSFVFLAFIFRRGMIQCTRWLRVDFLDAIPWIKATIRRIILSHDEHYFL